MCGVDLECPFAESLVSNMGCQTIKCSGCSFFPPDEWATGEEEELQTGNLEKALEETEEDQRSYGKVKLKKFVDGCLYPAVD